MQGEATIASQWEAFEHSYEYAQQRQREREEALATQPSEGRRIDEGDFAAWNMKWQAARDAKVQASQRQQTEIETTQLEVGLEIPSQEESERYLDGGDAPYMGPVSGWYHHQAQAQQQQQQQLLEQQPPQFEAPSSEQRTEEDRFRLSELGGYTPYRAKSSPATTPRGTPKVPIHERLFRDAKQKQREKEREQEPPLIDEKTGRPLFQPTVNSGFEAAGYTRRCDQPASERCVPFTVPLPRPFSRGLCDGT